MKLSSTVSLAILPFMFIGCEKFEVLSTRVAEPANIKVDFVVRKPSKNIRPVQLTEDLYLSQIDLRKFKITEDGDPLSLSEGGRAGVESCKSCSLNAVHLSLDYSGSVRDQFDNLIQHSANFVRKLKSVPGETKVRISFFAGDKTLYNPKGYPIYLNAETMANWLPTASCRDFSDDYGRSLCDADTATRLNTAIVENIRNLDVVFEGRPEHVTKSSIIFTDGRGRDKSITTQEVFAKVDEFKKKGGLFYTVLLESDEDNNKFFKEIAPTKQFKLKKISQLSEKLVDVLDDVQGQTPLFFTLKVCSAVRGGPTSMKISSRAYGVDEIVINYDTTNFGGGCDLNNRNQWKF
jgi:hypothetical protein